MVSNEKRGTVAYYEGEFDIHSGKCLSSLVRYLVPRISAVFSPVPASSLIQFAERNGIPVISKVCGIPLDTQRLMLATIHNDKDTLPALTGIIKDCIKMGIHVYNGDHLFLRPLFAPAEQQYVHDLRDSSCGLRLFSGELSRRKNQLRILTVGHDCNIGKMTVSLEMERFLINENHNVRFVATGQIGMMIKGFGIPLDRTIVDFTSGAMEAHLLEYDNQILVIEGQGSIFAPMYSGLTLAQVHGSSPHLLILCVDPSREHPRYFPKVDLPPIDKAILIYEQLASLIMPDVKVMGISANTSSMNEEDALLYISNLENQFKIPVIDPIRFGCEKFESSVNAWVSSNFTV